MTVPAQVKDKTGAVLPYTGGIGTTIFYTIGGLMVIGAGVVMIARKKANQ